MLRAAGLQESKSMLNYFQTSQRSKRWSGVFFSRNALRAVVVSAALCAGAGVMSAQNLAGSISPAAAYSSSASEQTDALVVTPVPDFSKMMVGAAAEHAQYANRPGYRSDFTNNDDSLKFTVYGGGGSTVPLADTSNYLTPNFDIQAGVGYRFNRHIELPVEFDWDQFGFTKSALDNQIGIYDSIFGAGAVNYLLDGNSHIWSFSLQPTYTFYERGPWGAYVKAGVGFYHKVANFTLPSAQFECYYFCGIYEANYNLDHYTSNAPGYDAGFGLTYKFSPDSRAKLYLEGRYVFIDNQQRYGITNTPASLATVSDSTTNFYPANSDRTEYIPLTVGIRF
jgi:hypothetical protein